VLGLATEGAAGPGRVAWHDGDARWNLVIEGRELVTVRRVAASRDGEAAHEELRSSVLRVLDPDGWRFADALGAARASPSATLAWRSDRRHGISRTVPVWRIALALTAVTVAGIGFLTAPGVAAWVVEHDAAKRLASLATARRDVVVAEQEIDKVTRALGEVSAFDASGYSMARMLADLTQALPDESALVTLRLARESASLVALTPRAAAMLVRLEGVRGIEGAEIVGPVTREVVAGKTLERVTIRFGVSVDARRQETTAESGGA
jgi:hypothetical protein